MYFIFMRTRNPYKTATYVISRKSKKKMFHTTREKVLAKEYANICWRVYRWLRANKDAEQMTPMASIFNGSLAGLLVQLITSPLKVLQINSVLYKNKVGMIAWHPCKLSLFLLNRGAEPYFISDRVQSRSQCRYGKKKALQDSGRDLGSSELCQILTACR